jgi:glycerophosphoryl diester phosphodiesterase
MLFKKHFGISVYLALFFLSFNLQCKKKEKISDDTYFGSKVIILGHHGIGAYYKMPANTYESVLPAIGIGCDGCEVDVHLTKDTVLILYHTHLLNPHTTCNGRINELTLEEVEQCKYYGLKNMVFVGSADELFSKLSNLNTLYFSFDCKLDNEVVNMDLYEGQFIRAIKRLCDKYNMSENVFIEASKPLLTKAKQMGLSNKFFLIGALNKSNIDTATAYSFYGISSQMDEITIENSDIAHAKGLHIMAYTPYNYYLNKSAIRKKIDLLETDDPGSILKQFNRFNYDYVIP